MKQIVSISIALVLHILVGWEWSTIGGIVAGFWVIRRGWVAGLITMSVAWGVLIVVNLIQAPTATQKYFEFAGSILGGLPSIVLPIATLAVAALLGAFAGFVGSSLAQMNKEPVVVEIE